MFFFSLFSFILILKATFALNIIYRNLFLNTSAIKSPLYSDKISVSGIYIFISTYNSKRRKKLLMEKSLWKKNY